MATARNNPKPEPDPEPGASVGKAGKQRTYVKQSDVPASELGEALRIPQAISDEYGKQPCTPLEVAAALRMQPSSGPFRMAAGAALAYGLTDAGPRADEIGITELGLRIVAPTEEGDDLAAKREAFLRPRIIREFLERYDGSAVPSDEIGKNVLERMGVTATATTRVLKLIVEGAESLGLLRDINGRKYVHLRGTVRLSVVPEVPDEHTEQQTADQEAEDEVSAGATDAPVGHPVLPVDAVPREDEPSEGNRRVFISHGSNKKIVNRLKELLVFGEFEPVVSVEKETTAKPVPDKVLDEMVSCGGGIIHVGVERVIVDTEGNEHVLLNDNVLIEIGVAMASWGKNFILLVEEGTQLPSNLQGLYEVRYEGDDLDAGATMKLLRAFKEFKRT